MEDLYFKLNKYQGYTTKEIVEILIEASRESRLDHFYTFNEESITLKNNYTLRFMDDKLELVGGLSDEKFLLFHEMGMKTLIPYFAGGVSNYLKFLYCFQRFENKLLEKLPVVIGRKGQGDGKVKDVVITLLCYYAVKKKYPRTILSIPRNQIYIPEMQGVSFKFHSNYPLLEKIKVSTEQDGISLYGNSKTMLKAITSGRMVEIITSQSLSVLYSGISCGIEYDFVDLILNKNTFSKVINRATQERDLILCDFKSELETIELDSSDVIRNALELEYRSVLFEKLYYFKYKDVFFHYNALVKRLYYSNNEKDLIKQINKG